MPNEQEHKYDLFISYADADKAWVEGYLLDAVTQAGVRCHSESAFTLGAPRLQEFERAIQQSQRTLLILSPAYMAEGFSLFVDLLAQSYGLETATWPVIPLTLHPVILPPRLSMLEGLDASDPAVWEAAISRLCGELRRPFPGPASKPPCPYPGMVPFSAKDDRFFYGRDVEIDQMLQHFRHQRYLWVIGPSGSGKSSLVNAGFLPRLDKSTLYQSGFWLVRSMRPGSQPAKELVSILEGHLSRIAECVSILLESNSPARRLLVVMDQFEELFTQAEPTEQTRFINALKVLRAMENCSLLIAMRADFYQDLMNSDLWPVEPSQRLEIAPLHGQALRRAIEQPAAVARVYLEAGLVEKLIADAADEPGALPLMQETMFVLWEKMQRRLLTLSAYDGLGGEGRSGLASAVVKRADATMADLSQEQRAIARRIFLRLVQFGEGRADTRRQQAVADLASVGEEPLFDQVLQHLADNRLLTMTGEEEKIGKKVDIAHEALLTGWPGLNRWITERRNAEKTRRRLEEKTQEWTRLGKRGGLLDAVEVAEAEQWVKSFDAVDLGCSQDLQALVQSSLAAIDMAEQEKEAIRQRELNQVKALAAEAEARRNAEEKARWEAEKRVAEGKKSEARLRARLKVSIGLGVTLLVAAIIALGAYLEAEIQRKISLSRELATNAYAQISVDPELSVRLSIEAISIAYTEEAERALRDAMAALAESHKRALLVGHKESVRSAYFSQDAKRVVTASEDKTAAIWDAETGKKILDLDSDHRHHDIVYCARFNKEGSLVASASKDKKVKIWDAEIGHLIRELPEFKAAVRCLSFSPDSANLAVGCEDGYVSLWNVKTGGFILEVDPQKKHEGAVYSISYSLDGSRIVTGSKDKSAKVWNTKNGKMICELRTDHNGAVRSANFSNNGRLVVTGCEDKIARIWNLDPVKVILNFTDHGGWVQASVFCPKDRYVATGSNDLKIRIWDLISGDKIHELDGHKGGINSLEFSSNGEYLVSASGDGTARVWQMMVNEKFYNVGEKETHAGSVRCANFSQDGKRIVTAGEDNVARVWDKSTKRMLFELVGHKGWVTSASFSPKGDRIVTSSGDRTACIWDGETGKKLIELIGHKGWVYSAAFCNEGKRIVTASQDKTAGVWDAASGGKILELKGHEGRVLNASFSKIGNRIVTAGEDKLAKVWDGKNGRLLFELVGHKGWVTSASFSPKGDRIVTSSGDRTACIWDGETGKKLIELIGHKGWVYSAAFCNEGKRIVTASQDKTAGVWDAASGGKISELSRQKGWVLSAVFSPTEDGILTASEDKFARIYCDELCCSLETLRSRAKFVRYLTSAENDNYLSRGKMKIWALISGYKLKRTE